MRQLGWVWLAASVSGCSCLDLNEGRSYPCDPTGGTDQCAGGWVCGLEGLCHDPSDGGPFLCQVGPGGVALSNSDSWCSGGWVCGKGGRCVLPLPGETSLRALADAGVPIAYDAISPVLLQELPLWVAFSFEQTAPSGMLSSTTVQTIAFIDDGGLTILGRQETQAQSVDGGDEQFSVAWQPWNTDTLDLAATIDGVFAQSDAGLWIVPTDGGSARLIPTVAATQLRQASPGDGPALAAFNACAYWMLGADGTVLGQGAFLDGGGCGPAVDAGAPAGSISQLTPAYTPLCPQTQVWFALDAQGNVSAAGWDSTLQALQAWMPVSLAGGGPDSGLVAFDIQALPNLMVAALADTDGGNYVGMWQRSLGACPDTAPKPLLAPCPVCSSSFIDRLHPVSPVNGVPSVEVHCGADTFGSESVETVQPNPLDGTCVDAVVQSSLGIYSDVLLAADAMPGNAAYAGAHGQLLFGSTIETADELVLDRVPDSLVAWRDRYFATVGPEQYGWTPGAGVFRSTAPLAPSTTMVSSVDGAPNWGVFGDGTISYLWDPDDLPDGGEEPGALDDVNDPSEYNMDDGSNSYPISYEQLGPSVSRFGPPFRAANTASPMGVPVTVVSTGDTLLGAHQSNTSAFLVLDVIAIPSPGADIRSVVLLPPTDTGANDAEAHGYALTFTGLFRFDGSVNSTQWATQLVDLGTPVATVTSGQPIFDTPVRVFGNQQQAWVGLADGTIYTLPNLIQVAPTFGTLTPPGGLPFWQWSAIDFEVVCGTPHVVTAVGVYRLDPVADQRIGAWTLDTAFGAAMGPSNATSPGLYASSFHSTGDELYLSDVYGTVARLRADGCVP